VCGRHVCQVCTGAATMKCVFCPVSYCDQHTKGHITTVCFMVDNHRIRHRVCTAHRKTPIDSAKARHRQSSKLKTPVLKDEGKTEPEIPAADLGTADTSSTAENIGSCKSVSDVFMSLQSGGNDDDDDDDAGKVEGLQGGEKLTARPAPMASPTHEEQLRVKPTPQQKLIAAKLLKKNGISVDVVDAGSLISSEMTVESGFRQTESEKPRLAAQSAESTGGVEEKPGKRRRTPVVNRSGSMCTRTRSSLQDNCLMPKMSQTLNNNELETPVNGIVTVASTVTALLDEMSESENLELLNWKELAVDGN